MKRLVDYQKDEMMKLVSELKPLFSTYFDVMNDDDLSFMVLVFFVDYEKALPVIWSEEKAGRKVDAFESALRKLKLAYYNLPRKITERVGNRITLEAFESVNYLEVTKTRSLTVEEKESAEKCPSLVGWNALMELIPVIDSIIPPLQRASHNMLEQRVQLGTKWIEGWRLIEATSKLSQKYPSKVDFPESLSSSDTAHGLLIGVFKAFGIDRDFKMSYKHWFEYKNRSGQK